MDKATEKRAERTEELIQKLMVLASATKYDPKIDGLVTPEEVTITIKVPIEKVLDTSLKKDARDAIALIAQINA